MPGDCNDDGELSAGDLSCVTADNSQEVLEALSLSPGDLNDDGRVAFDDFARLAENFGSPEVNCGRRTDERKINPIRRIWENEIN